MCKIANQGFSGKNEKSYFVTVIHRTDHLYVSQRQKCEEKEPARSPSLKDRGAQEVQWKVLLCVRHKSRGQKGCSFHALRHPEPISRA